MGVSMCDISEEEQVEYLLWKELARARAAERREAPVTHRRLPDATTLVPLEPAVA
jgi:hypothetical protein